MRTYRSTAVAVLTAVLALGTLTAVATPAVAAGPAPLAPVDLHPDGSPPFEQVRPSPVEFEAVPAPGDDVGIRGQERYVVQQHPAGKAGNWQQVASVVGPTAVQVPLPEGDSRWRARVEADDGTPGPWSPWIRFTVDSRHPADPTVSIPDAPVTIGVPVQATITSPDGLAAYYYLSSQEVPLTYIDGQDPCHVADTVCVAPGQHVVTVPWAFLQDNFSTLYVTAYGRNSLTSNPVRTEPDGLIQPDDAALAAAHRWPVPSTGGPATTLKDVHRGPGLRVGPALTVTTQQITDYSTSPRRRVDVPSAVLAPPSTTAYALGPVVDPSSAFSVGAVLQTPTASHGDLTVLAQPGDGGLSFSLGLTSTNAWKFCVASAAGEQGCSLLSVDPIDASTAVVGRYDPVDQVVSLSVGRFSEDAADAFVAIAPLRAVTGALRFGSAAVEGTRRYNGPVGSPFVARGWISAPQVTSLLAGAA